MKTISAILLLAAVSACSPPSVKIPLTERPAVSREELSHSLFRYADITNAIAHAVNKEDVLHQLAVDRWQEEVENLAGFSAKELSRRLDCVRRGTSTSGYTEEQILTAIHIKEQRQAGKL